MRRGFTILELLVASFLLGMLMTILTMIFNQSSISWRTGILSITDLEGVREDVATVREDADNVFVWANTAYRIVSPWDENGGLRKRAMESPSSGGKVAAAAVNAVASPNALPDYLSLDSEKNAKLNDGISGYTVNVMSGGPNNDIMDWKAIWSYPDDFD